MRRGLVLGLIALQCTASVAATTYESEQDLAAGQLIFEVVQAKASAPETDQQIRSVLGSSLEFLFLQLQRSRSDGSRLALARTIVLDCDAGCGSSQQDAILSKGPAIEKHLRMALSEYAKLCIRYAKACASKDVAEKRAQGMIEALRNGQWKVKP